MLLNNEYWNNPEEGLVMLTPNDFPSEWQDYYHPDDLKYFYPGETKPFLFMYDGQKIFARFISFSHKEKSKIFGITFIVDTGLIFLKKNYNKFIIRQYKGAPYAFYFGPKTWEFLKQDGFLKMNQNSGQSFAFVQLHGHKFGVLPAPVQFDQANILGLKAIRKFGLVIDDKEVEWKNIKDI